MTAAIIVLLVVIGIMFLAIELFIIPGFSVPGLIGIAMIGYGIFKAMLAYGIQGMLTTFVLSILTSILLIKISLRSASAKKLSLDFDVGEAHAVDDYSSLLGKAGSSLTALRPSGIAMIDSKRTDVVTNGEFIDPHIPLNVIQIDGTRIVVAMTQDSDKDARTE